MERDLSTALQRAIEAGDQVLTAEVMPPRGADPTHMLAMATSLQGRVPVSYTHLTLPTR